MIGSVKWVRSASHCSVSAAIHLWCPKTLTPYLIRCPPDNSPTPDVYKWPMECTSHDIWYQIYRCSITIFWYMAIRWQVCFDLNCYVSSYFGPFVQLPFCHLWTSTYALTYPHSHRGLAPPPFECHAGWPLCIFINAIVSFPTRSPNWPAPPPTGPKTGHCPPPLYRPLDWPAPDSVLVINSEPRAGSDPINITQLLVEWNDILYFVIGLLV